MKFILFTFLLLFIAEITFSQENHVYFNFENIAYANINNSAPSAPLKSLGFSGGYSKNFKRWFAVKGQMRYYWVKNEVSVRTYQSLNTTTVLSSIGYSNMSSLFIGPSVQWHGRNLDLSLKLEPYVGFMLFSYRNEKQVAYNFGFDGFIGSTDYYSYKSSLLPVWAFDMPLGYQVTDELGLYVGVSFMGTMKETNGELKSSVENPLNNYPLTLRNRVEQSRLNSPKFLRLSTGSFQFGIRYTFNPQESELEVFEWEDGDSKVD